MSSALALAALMLTPEPIALEELIAFSDPLRCEPAPAFSAIIDALWTTRADRSRTLSVIPNEYREAFGDTSYAIGNNGFVSIGMATKGAWHGAPLLGLDLSKEPGAKAPTLHLHFGMPLTAARDALFAQGFRFGKLPDAPTISLRPNLGAGSTTILTCDPNG